MAKSKEPKFPPPLNMSEDITDLSVIDSGVMSVSDDAAAGVLTIVCSIGHYDFLIGQVTANQLIQQLREFVAGDSKNMLEAET